MFKQRKKDNFMKRLNSCEGVKHLFDKNKGNCRCGNYYKENGLIFSNRIKELYRHRAVANTADFKYKATGLSRRAKKLAKGRLNYALARRLGFSSYEAGTMAQWSEKRIREYAGEKA